MQHPNTAHFPTAADRGRPQSVKADQVTCSVRPVRKHTLLIRLTASCCTPCNPVDRPANPLAKPTASFSSKPVGCYNTRYAKQDQAAAAKFICTTAACRRSRDLPGCACCLSPLSSHKVKLHTAYSCYVALKLGITAWPGRPSRARTGCPCCRG